MKKNLLKLFILTLIVLANIGTKAQCLDATLTPYESRCVSTGSIVVNVNAGVGPFIYDFVSYPTEYTYVGPSTVSNITGLPPGNYTIRVIDQGNSGCFVDYTTTVAGSYVEPSFTVTSTPTSGCNNATNGSLTGTWSDGRNPITYDIIQGPAGTVGLANSTGSFTGLPAGTYRVAGHDSCGNTRTYDVTIAAFSWNTCGATVTKTGCGAYTLDAVCTTPALTGATYGIVRAPGDTVYASSLPMSFSNSDATIGSTLAFVKDACGNVITQNFSVQDWTIASGNITLVSCDNYEVSGITLSGTAVGPIMYGVTRSPGDTIWSSTLPFTYTDTDHSNTYDYANYTSIFVKDGCGVIKSYSNFYVDIYGGYSAGFENCTTSYINLAPSWYYSSPVTYTMTSPVLGTPQSSGNYTGLADGTYSFDITDACGRIHSETVTLNHEWQLSAPYAQNACATGKSIVSFYLPTNSANPLTITQTDASYNVISTLVGNYTSTTQYFDNLDANTVYNYIVSDACGRTDTVSVLTTNGSTPLSHTTTVEPLCTGKGNIIATAATDHGGYLMNDYGKIGSAVILGQNYWYANSSNTPYTVTYANVDTGTYWVRYWSAYCTDYMYDTVKINKYVYPKLRKSTAFLCNTTPIVTNVIASVKGGKAPYTYEIFETYPVNNPVPPQSSKIFTLNGNYSLVRLRVTDACGNTSLQDLAVRPIGPKSIKTFAPAPICNAPYLDLMIDSSISSQTYEWRDPAGNIVSTAPTYRLLLPTTDTGIYTCRVIIPGTCYDTTSSINIRSKDLKCYTSLGNYVWNDLNRDGIQNNGEVGVAGVTVVLYDNNNNIIGSTVTDAYGYYNFEKLDPGTYHVGFTLPANYVFTGQNQGSDDALDSDPNPATGITGDYVLTIGGDNPTVDAGIYLPTPTTASVGNFVWNDLNGDGIQNPGEPGFSGITVTLYDASGNPVATTITDANGQYAFTDLVPGTYSVGFTAPPGYVFSPSGIGGNALDSNPNPLTGLTTTFTLAPGENNTTIDAGLHAQAPTTGSLGNLVWNDVNNNGVQDPGENGVSGVTVNLYGPDGTTVIATTTTNEFGQYIFNNLPAGDYVVGFSNLPAGFNFSTPNAGTNDATDSDPSTTTGLTAVITLHPGEINLTVDAGINNPTLPLGALGDKVWFDANKNGVQDAGENGVAGIIVTLYDNTGAPIATTTTDANGNYIFNNLPAGTYTVGYSNLPAGYNFTGPLQGGNTATDSDPLSNGMTNPIVLGAGEVNLTIDAGLVTSVIRDGTATLGDIVWNDVNNNGIQDPGETGVAGVTVTLYAADGVTVVKTTTTDALGNYIFTGLNAGNYVVGFSNLPAGFTFSAANQGTDPELDANADATTGGLTSVITLGLGEENLSIDAGLHQAPGLASLGNYVWNDLNQDGVQDASEPGVAGVQVQLFDATTGALLATTVTDANGLYQFTGLTPGSYFVEFSNLPSGFTFTDPIQGGDATLDSDADPNNGSSSTVTLVAGENNTTIDAGIVSDLASLGNFVWNDLDQDGIQDPNEPGVAGVTVTLYNELGVPVASTITNSNGAYNFVNLIPGTYSVGFTNIPAGSVFSPASQGADQALDSDVNPATGLTTPVLLEAGDNNLTIDAGIYVPIPAGLGNYVWIDANQNGLQDANEVGVPGVTVTLYNEAGVAIQTTVTDQNGAYSFPNLTPGTYSIGISNLPIIYNAGGNPMVSYITSQNAGNDALDSDIDPATSKTGTYTLVAGEYNSTVDAGIFLAFVLPVHMTSFTANANNCKVNINWTTVSEENTSNFIVTRKNETTNRFIEIATIAASGNANTTKAYSYTDESANKGVNEYKLKIVDNNGTITYSDIISVINNCEINDGIKVYPNPATDIVNVLISAKTTDTYSIKITDINGKTIYNTTTLVENGTKNIVLPVSSLSVGQYNIHITHATENQVIKFTKVK